MGGACQRWRDGRDRYRPARETIDPGRHEVALIDETTAKRFVERHHYSHAYPAARLRVGLFRKERFAKEILAGVAVFSVPMNQRAIPVHSGVEPHQGVELGRFVLLDEVEGNGETWFLARAVRHLAERLPEVKALLSYSDPVPRIIGGHLVKPGHCGRIYQGANFWCRGRTQPRWLIVSSRTGTVVSDRTLSKIRNGERGFDYAMRQLRALGAPALAPGEDPRAWLRRALASDAFRRFRHPGNWIYCAPIGGREARRRLAPPEGAHPYPKLPDPPFRL